MSLGVAGNTCHTLLMASPWHVALKRKHHTISMNKKQLHTFTSPSPQGRSVSRIRSRAFSMFLCINIVFLVSFLMMPSSACSLQVAWRNQQMPHAWVQDDQDARMVYLRGVAIGAGMTGTLLGMQQVASTLRRLRCYRSPSSNRTDCGLQLLYAARVFHSMRYVPNNDLKARPDNPKGRCSG